MVSSPDSLVCGQLVSQPAALREAGDDEGARRHHWANRRMVTNGSAQAEADTHIWSD